MAMILSVPSFGTTVLVLFCFLPVLVWVRHRIVDVKIKRAGGVRAPILACDLFNGAFLSDFSVFCNLRSLTLVQQS
jgi:hypothetical protein